MNVCLPSNRLASEKNTVELITSFSKERNVGRRLQRIDDEGFQAFILPLEQDFTKSSKGYSSQMNYTVGRKDNDTFVMFSEDFSSVYDSTLLNSINEESIKLNGDPLKITHDYPVNSNNQGVTLYDNVTQMHPDCQVNPCCFSDSDDDEYVVYSNICNAKLEKCDSDSCSAFMFSQVIDAKNDNSYQFSDRSSNFKCGEYCSGEEFFKDYEENDSFDSCEKLNRSCQDIKCTSYINFCFEDYKNATKESSLLDSVNEKWNDSMEDVPSEPREPKRVSFCFVII